MAHKLKALFAIDSKYRGSKELYCFRYLADPFVVGVARSDLADMMISGSKKVFEKQHGEETMSLIRMLLLDCGDKKSSDSLREYDTQSDILFAGKTVEEEKREAYNLRRLFVNVANDLNATQLDNVVTLLQDEGVFESVPGDDFRTLLLLFERANQMGIILPQKLDKLKEWLEIVGRDDLIRLVNQFDPKNKFPGKRYNCLPFIRVKYWTF